MQALILTSQCFFFSQLILYSLILCRCYQCLAKMYYSGYVLSLEFVVFVDCIEYKGLLEK